jgi:hypothetical protein
MPKGRRQEPEAQPEDQYDYRREAATSWQSDDQLFSAQEWDEEKMEGEENRKWTIG